MLKIMKCVVIVAAALLLLLLVYNACKDIADRNEQYAQLSTGGYTSPTEESLDSTESDSRWEELLTYAEYLEMTAQERSDFAASFEDPSEFFQWLKAVKEIYEQERKENELGQDGVIDMDKIDP